MSLKFPATYDRRGRGIHLVEVDVPPADEACDDEMTLGGLCLFVSTMGLIAFALCYLLLHLSVWATR